jgi:diadenylate cyclase
MFPIETLISYLSTFRMQDILDVVIISLLIYGFLIWFKKTSSRFMLVGIILLGVVYAVSRYFQLYMTASILQGFFAVLIFALIVIFQEELRRFLERLAIWGRIRKKSATTFERDIEIITSAVANLARRKIGALIVIMGEEPLGRHIEEGVHLNGILSQPLLESIFDPHSIGHDGAVLIDEGRIVQFGCHLPLSSNSKEFGNIGLRHTAALGLSERSDALCIVVSEERGTISIVRAGRLDVLENAPALKTALEEFYALQTPGESAKALSLWFRENTLEKALAVGLACILWIGFGYQREIVQRDVTIPIEYRNLSSEWIIEEPKMTEAKIMLMGPEQAFHLFNPSSLKISLDLSRIKQGGQEVTLSRDMIKTPSNISIVGIKPERIHIMAFKLITVKIPIDVRTTGSPPSGYIIEKVEVNPSVISVLIPPKHFREGMTIRTKPVNLKTINDDFVFTPECIIPPEIRFPDDKIPPITVTIKVRPR